MKDVLTIKGAGTLSNGSEAHAVEYTVTSWEDRKTGRRTTSGIVRGASLPEWRGERAFLILLDGTALDVKIAHAAPDVIVVLLDVELPGVRAASA